MNLGQLIDGLKGVQEQDRKVPKGFVKAHSWRGVYAELAFEPASGVTIAEMLKEAESAVGKTFTGYKGGDFRMDRETDIHISFSGESYDYLGEIVAFYLFGQKTTTACEDCGERVVEPLAENHSRVKCLEKQLEWAKEQEARRASMKV